MENRKLEEDFKNHKIAYHLKNTQYEILEFKKEGTDFYKIIFFVNLLEGVLQISGDIGYATYNTERNMTLKDWCEKIPDYHYFVRRCESSEKGFQYGIKPRFYDDKPIENPRKPQLHFNALKRLNELLGE